MRCALGALALTVLPAAAEAIALNVKNCSAASVDVAAVHPADTIASTRRTILPGGTGQLFCSWEECRLEITYYTPMAVAARFGTYRDDRCTRGVADKDVGDLPTIGNCGC